MDQKFLCNSTFKLYNLFGEQNDVEPAIVRLSKTPEIDHRAEVSLFKKILDYYLFTFLPIKMKINKEASYIKSKSY